jgi:phosphatidylinositol alpha-1,6-mannosyltransferase
MTRRTPDVLLAAASLQPGKGGISRVARLMARVLAERAALGQLRLSAVTLADPDAPGDLALPVKAAAGNRHRFVAAALRRGLTCSHVVYDAPPVARAHALPPLRYRPSLAFAHGIEVWENAPAKYIAAARRMTRLLVNSDFTRLKAEALHGGFARADVCWLATEEDVPPPPPAVPVSGRPPVVLIVGRLLADRPKGHRELIACWPGVLAEVPGATLSVVGEGPDRPALQALAAASPAAANIVFHGFVAEADLGGHYAAARVYAMPSRGEGFGLVYVEAMRHGLPVVGSVHDAAPEVIEDGQTGYAVDQDDPAVLTAALVRLLRDPARAAAFGQAGRQRWAIHYRYDAFRERFGAILEEFLHAKRRTGA